MADEIFNIKIEGLGQATNELAAMDAELKKLTATRTELLEKQKQGNQLTEKEQAELVKLNNGIKVVSTEMRNKNKQVETDIKLQRDATGAYQKLSIELNEARKKAKDLATAHGVNSKEAKAATAAVNDMDKKIKAVDASVGQHQRNVGNYSSALDGIGGSVGNAVQGVKGFNTTLKANPILAVISLLIGLISWFKTLQPVVDKITKIMGGFNAVMGVLIERFKLLLSGDFAGAFKEIGSAIADANRAGMEYEATLKRITDAQQIQNIQNSEAEKQIAALNAQLRDKSKSYEELISITNEITRIETESFNKQKKINEETLANERQKVTMLLKSRGVNIELLKSTEDLIAAAQEYALQNEDFKGLVDAQIALNDSEKESLALTERISSRRNSLDEQRLASIQRIKEANEKQAEAEAKQLAALAENLKKIQEEIINAEDEEWERKQKKYEKEDAEEKARFDKKMADEDARIQADIKKKTDAQSFISQFNQQTIFEALDAEKAKIDQMLADGLITQQQHAEAAKVIQSDRWNANLEVAQNVLGQIGNLLGKQTTAGKLAASAATAINTYQAIMRSLAMYGWTPIGIAAMAATAATGVAQIAKINSTKTDKFAKGGIIGGNYHSHGGTTFVGSDGSRFEAEKGELLAIVNRHDTERLRALSDANSVHGKAFFARGGIVSPGAMVNDNNAAVLEAVRTLGAQKVYVLESDITKKQRHVQVIEQRGDF